MLLSRNILHSNVFSRIEYLNVTVPKSASSLHLGFSHWIISPREQRRHPKRTAQARTVTQILIMDGVIFPRDWRWRVMRLSIETMKVMST